jgi:gas vesicle protein
VINHNHNYTNREQDSDASEPGGARAGILAGLLIGSLAGAVAMLLLAPQSGKQTRAKLQRQSHELRKQATATVEDAMAHAHGTARQITHDVRKQAEKLEQRGQALLDEQKGNLAAIIEAGKNAAQGNRN